MYDVIIAGGGPAGLSAGLRAKESDLDYLILEKEQVCNTLLKTYHRGKLVTEFPQEEEVKGKLWFERCKVEELIERWRETAQNLNVKEGEEVTRVEKKGEIFQVTTEKNSYEGKAVVMAIGKEGKPRKIGVKGEDLSKVHYRLKDPENYQNEDILIVGGGDSAADAALDLCQDNEVVVSYRRSEFFRLNKENLEEVEEKCRCREMEVIFNSNVKEIKEDSVVLDIEGEEEKFENDTVFIFAGSELPIDFFKEVEGVETEEDKVVLDENYQTSLENLFVIGDASGREAFLIKPAINEGYVVVNLINSKVKD